MLMQRPVRTTGKREQQSDTMDLWRLTPPALAKWGVGVQIASCRLAISMPGAGWGALYRVGGLVLLLHCLVFKFCPRSPMHFSLTFIVLACCALFVQLLFDLICK